MVLIDDAAIGGDLDQVRYVGRWETVTGHDDGRSLGTSTRSYHRGDAATVRFSGTQVRVYGVLGHTGGYATLVLDGVPNASPLDFYASAVTPGARVYASPVLRPGEHSLTIVVTGSKGMRSTGTFVNLDHLEVVRERSPVERDTAAESAR